MAKKEKFRAYLFSLVVALSIIALVYIYNPGNTEQHMNKISGMTVKNLEEENAVVEENNYRSVVKLDECLQDCQYKICKKNCELGNIIEAECFRDCLDECNDKCLKVYG